MLTPLVAAVGASIAGAFLSRAACTLTASDDGPDWRGRDRRFRLWVSGVVIVTSMASTAVAVVVAPSVPFAVSAASFAALGPGLAMVDIAARRLPFLYIGIGVAIAILGLAFTPDLGRSLVVALVVAVAMIALSLASKGGAGGGDVAFAALAALALTWTAGWWLTALTLVTAMFLTGMTGLLARLVRNRTRLPPYGPSLLACWWLAYVYSIVDLLGKKEALARAAVVGPGMFQGPQCSAAQSSALAAPGEEERRMEAFDKGPVFGLRACRDRAVEEPRPVVVLDQVRALAAGGPAVAVVADRKRLVRVVEHLHGDPRSEIAPHRVGAVAEFADHVEVGFVVLGGRLRLRFMAGRVGSVPVLHFTGERPVLLHGEDAVQRL